MAVVGQFDYGADVLSITSAFSLVREAGCLYSLYCLEEEFSETHLQVIEKLYVEVPKTPRWSPHRHIILTQHVVGLDRYAGLWAP